MYRNGVIEKSFVDALNEAGHTATFKHQPTERDFIKLLNGNDIVVVVAHGPRDFGSGLPKDKNGQDIPGLALGGTSIHPLETAENVTGRPGGMEAYWVTPNELQGQVKNEDPILTIVGCYIGKSRRLQQATNAGLVVGSPEFGNAGDDSLDMFRYVVDLLNDRPDVARTNLQSRAPRFVFHER